MVLFHLLKAGDVCSQLDDATNTHVQCITGARHNPAKIHSLRTNSAWAWAPQRSPRTHSVGVLVHAGCARRGKVLKVKTEKQYDRPGLNLHLSLLPFLHLQSRRTDCAD
jgi:hypothetical protein